MAKLVEKAERLPSISAFSASLSQRSCNIRQLATTSGELAILARRAQSAACSRQYLAYDDITRSLTHPVPERAALAKIGVPRRPAAKSICADAAELKTQGSSRTDFQASCCIAVTAGRASGDGSFR